MGSKVLKCQGMRWLFWCPACKKHHFLQTEQTKDCSGRWSWNYNELSPTITPSISITSKDHKGKIHRCHFFVRNGKIQYLSDCTHELAGTTVYMVDIDKV